MSAARVHPTALVEPDVRIGDGTAIWDHVHLRRGARIGAQCIVGEKTYVAYDVVIGDLCKINGHVSICAGVTIGRGVLIAAHVVFTNEKLPRAADPELARLLPSEPTARTLRTRVEDGASVGANATIGPGLTLGKFCVVGMGSVVTGDVPPHALVAGNPARLLGLVARDGTCVWRGDRLVEGRYVCPGDGVLVVAGGRVRHEP
jgi:acetyltransferase-like isoleucine patch superfamily enzyme